MAKGDRRYSKEAGIIVCHAECALGKVCPINPNPCKAKQNAIAGKKFPTIVIID